jgi:hypothetical protein
MVLVNLLSGQGLLHLWWNDPLSFHQTGVVERKVDKRIGIAVLTFP